MSKKAVGSIAPLLRAADAVDPQADVIAFLEHGNAFADCKFPWRMATHAASIFLSGDRAWKLKRAVHFDYLNFLTPDKRRDVLRTEFQLNRRTAPDLYRALHAVTRDSAGQLAIDGSGEAID